MLPEVKLKKFPRLNNIAKLPGQQNSFAGKIKTEKHRCFHSLRAPRLQQCDYKVVVSRNIQSIRY